MIATMLRPILAVWRTLVEYHREHLADDPDVEKLREQQREAQQANRRLNIVEQRYLWQQGETRHEG